MFPSCGQESRSNLSQGDGARSFGLPGASGPIDFDDIEYSDSLERLLVPAVENGLYLLNPTTGKARRVGGVERADSVDAGSSLIFVLDKAANTVTIVDAQSERSLSVTRVGASTDYVRYVAAAREVWVTEPPSRRIEVFKLANGANPRLRTLTYIRIPNGGPEALTIAPKTRKAFTHSFGGDLFAIDLRRHRIVRSWPGVCDGAHGFPRIDEAGLALASCEQEGAVVLVDATESGRELGRYAVGGGVALPAFSPRTHHFYVRSDPGDELVTLKATARGLKLLRRVTVPEEGHCLTADDLGHYWTCDASRGRILRFTDPTLDRSG